MKKLSILLIGLLLISGFVFAQDEGATLAATGSIDLKLGADLNDDTPNLPQFSGTTSATTTLTLGTSDEKVSASMVIDLLALPGVSTALDFGDNSIVDYINDTESNTGPLDTTDRVYETWHDLIAAVDYWNDNNDTDDDLYELMAEFTNAGTSAVFAAGYTWRTATAPLVAPFDAETDVVANTTAFSAETLGKIVADQLWDEFVIGGTNGIYNLVDEVESDGDIILKDLVAVSSDPDADEFNFAGADDGIATDEAGDAYYALIDDLADLALGANPILDEWLAQLYLGIDEFLSDTLTTDLDDGTPGVQDFYALIGAIAAPQDVFDGLDGVDFDQFGKLTATEREALKKAVDVDIAFVNIFDTVYDEPMLTETLSSAAIKSFTFAVMGVGGVLDFTGGASSNVGVDGAIYLDGKGHTDDTVKSYPYLVAGLSDGVVDGLGFDIMFYSDGNDAEDRVEIDDDWYTELSEGDADDPVEPALGLGTAVSYSMDLSDDMTVGATAKIGIYDLLGGDDLAFGFSLNPTFSGFGANANVIFANGLGMTHVYVGADYTIMGIMPAVGFRYVDNGDDGNQVVYVEDDEYASGDAAVLGEGGINIDFGVDADLSEFLPIAASVGVDVSYAMPTDFDAVLGYAADLSVTPIDIVTVTAALGNVGIDEGDADVSPLTWSVGLSSTPVENVTVTAGIGQKWDSTDDVGYLAPSAGVSLAHGAATLSASYSTSYEAADDEVYGAYSLGMKVSF